MRISRKYKKKILVFLATYNETGNVEKLIQSILKYLPDKNLLVIDDNSSDGTGERLDVLSKNNELLNIIHRPYKMGLGSAHKLAMQYAIKEEFEILITMDADFSHHPKYLPTIIMHLEDNDFVIGSRYVEGGGLGYGFLRKSLSISANLLTRNLLNIPLKECTTSYRGFQVSLLKKMNLNNIRSDGYSFFIECIFNVNNLTSKMKEFPIFFYDRESGTSKISKVEILKSISCLFKLFFEIIIQKIYLDENLQEKNNTFIDCPVCKSHYQICAAKKNIINKKNQIRKSIEKKIQCLQCGEFF